MNIWMSLIRFQQGRSYSEWVDWHQIYIRNVILFGVGLSVTRLLFGETIHCQGPVGQQSFTQTFLDTKCYINGTIKSEKENICYIYYQFTSVFLLLLSIALQIPYSIWCKWTGTGRHIRELEQLAEKPQLALQAIYESKNLYVKTVTLEVFYGFYWVLLLSLTNLFFNGYWQRFGWRLSTLEILFPDFGHCLFDYFHSSGSTKGTFMCLLPLNSIYRKVFFTLYLIVVGTLFNYCLLFLYRVYLFLTYSRKELERRWAFKIVNEYAASWSVRKTLESAIEDSSYNLV